MASRAAWSIAPRRSSSGQSPTQPTSMGRPWWSSPSAAALRTAAARSCSASAFGSHRLARAHPAPAPPGRGLLPDDPDADAARDDRPDGPVQRAGAPGEQRQTQDQRAVREQLPEIAADLGFVPLRHEQPERDVRDDAHAGGDQHGERQADDEHLEPEMLGAPGAHATDEPPVGSPLQARRGEVRGLPAGRFRHKEMVTRSGPWPHRGPPWETPEILRDESGVSRMARRTAPLRSRAE